MKDDKSESTTEMQPAARRTPSYTAPSHRVIHAPATEPKVATVETKDIQERRYKNLA